MSKEEEDSKEKHTLSEGGEMVDVRVSTVLLFVLTNLRGGD